MDQKANGLHFNACPLKINSNRQCTQCNALMSSVLFQVEVWARSKDEYLTGLAFLDEDSRKAIALVGNFMRMMECRLAIENLKRDETFQTDAVDAQVQKAIAECTENPQNIRKCVPCLSDWQFLCVRYASNGKIMGVLVKLKRLQEVLKRNGRMKVVYEELLNSDTPSSNPSSEAQMTTEELEKALKTAKEAVVKAVIGGQTIKLITLWRLCALGSSVSKKPDEGTSTWWSTDASSSGAADGDGMKIGSGAFLKVRSI